ncbi:MAG: TM2 domain-containing protein [Lachnospiraceae bacterium]|nr:TM2 domain-containing protein [Lachnospiraceae bacterium]
MEGQKYCKHCGELIDEECVVCPKCGKQVEDLKVAEPTIDPSISPKSWIATLLLCLFLGVIGIHRFYTGKIGTGIIMLVCAITGFGLVVTGIWALVDFIMVCMGKFKDKQGRYVKRS